ncbi:MAG: transposase, partial [Acinetobacter sp.]|nr:transposase [Acinetobacter sp.]
HTVKGYDEKFYSVKHIPDIFVGAKVDVVVNPYRAPDIDVLTTNEHGEQVIYTCVPDQLDIFGQLHDAPVIGQEIQSMPNSKIDESRNRIMKQAFNANTQAEVDKALKKRTPAYQGQIDVTAHITKHDVPEYLPRAGQQMDIQKQKNHLPPLNYIQAAKQIKGLVGDAWTAEHMGMLKKEYSDGNVPQEDIPHWVDRIQGGRNKPKLKVVGE